MHVLGVDIGGTKVASGRVTGLPTQAELDAPAVIPTLGAQGFEVSLQQVYKAIETRLTDDVSAIGICAPGPLNPKTGVVLNPPNLPGWRNIPLAAMVTERYGLPCRVENDANAAGLAEWMFGAARGFSNVVYATLSTGIGTGIVLDGRIYHGKNGAAAEGGHVIVDYDSDRRCGCGVMGCIEALASGTAIAARGWNCQSLTSEQLTDITEKLGAWLGSIISLLDPDIIVIGGGLTGIGDPLFARLRELAPRRTINQFASETPIVPALLSNDAGVYGAAAVAYTARL